MGDVWYLKADSSKYIITGFAKDVYPDDVAVLFNTGDMVDSFTLLNSNLFTGSTPTSSKEDNPIEVNRSIEEFQNADGLWSAFQIALNFPTLSVPDVTTSYELGYIESEQESYEGQHTQEAYWNDNDLVPNPGKSERKRFKLW